MEATVGNSLSIFAASAILLAGVVDDLRARKVHNWLFLACVAFALAVTLVNGGVAALPSALLGLVAGIIVMLPLVLMKMVGAGDMKLLAAFGIVAGWTAVTHVALYSVIWGAIFGLVRVVVKGELKSVVNNMMAIATLKERSQLELHKMPFTVALMVGWMTYLVYQRVL